MAKSFPAFSLISCSLETVNQFKYLGHIIDNSFSDDDDKDISREIKTLFARTNVLGRRFKRCSVAVKDFFVLFASAFTILPYGHITPLVHLIDLPHVTINV